MPYPYQVFDAHCDTISEILDSGEELVSNQRHLNLEWMRCYNGYIQIFAAWIDEKQPNWLVRALQIIDCFYAEMQKNKDSLLLITDSSTLQRVKEEKKIGAVLSIEDARCLCGSLANLRMLHRLGVRAITLSWNHDNDVADGTFSVRNAGLTPFGKEVVKEMNRLQMVIDVSHMTRKGFWDVMEVSDMPVIASHSNCDAVCPHPRNLDDGQILELIRTGGMIGLNIYPEFLTANGTADLDDILRHSDHILSLGGERILGLGTDFDGVPKLPEGISHAGELYRLFDKMKQIGYKDSLIEDITHRNFENFLDKMLKNEKK